MLSLGYPPHLTLAVFDRVEESRLISVVESIAATQASIRVSFDRVGYFETPDSIVLWAAPAVAEILAEVHRAVHIRVDPASCRASYRPGAWIPHCSLAVRVPLSRRSEAIAMTGAGFLPFEVVFDVIDCARFPPVEVIHEKLLRKNQD